MRKYAPSVFKISKQELYNHGVPEGYELVMPCPNSAHYWVKLIGWIIPKSCDLTIQ